MTLTTNGLTTAHQAPACRHIADNPITEGRMNVHPVVDPRRIIVHSGGLWIAMGDDDAVGVPLENVLAAIAEAEEVVVVLAN